MGYEERIYRTMYSDKELYHFRVIVDETDLDIAVNKDSYNEGLRKKTEAFVYAQRRIIQEYIKLDPAFLGALKPHNPQNGAPAIIRKMCESAKMAAVGPMAAIAGLLSETVGNFLTGHSDNIIVENGGDIWLKSTKTRIVAIYAGDSTLSCRIGLEVSPERTPLGICTSSGTVGHSLSFGKADAVVILALSAVLADAVATAACNMVQTVHDLEKAVRFACGIKGVTGAAAIIDDRLAVFGDIKLIPIEFARREEAPSDRGAKDDDY